VDGLRAAHAIDGVILGGTELPLLLRSPEVAGLPVLDTTALHVEAIVSALQSGRVPGPDGEPGAAAARAPSAEDVGMELREVVSRAVPALLALSSAESARSSAPGKWSPREIVGHLVDSALNNHRRFLGARWKDDLVFEGYDQDAWVAAQEYGRASWPELVDLWRAVNLHVARVMDTTPDATRARSHVRHSLDRIAYRPVRAGDAATLEFLMRDYVAHLRHHLAQILGPAW